MQKSISIVSKLRSLANKVDKEGMSRFGINTEKAFGIRIPELRKIAKEHKNDHELALELWKTEFHEARILASMIEDPRLLSSSQMDEWVNDFGSWDLCDQCCINLFTKSPLVIEKIREYSQNNKEFVKRTAFSMMASYAVKGKKVSDEVFIEFFQIIEREAYDNRNFVKKAVNWALRQIGKKNKNLCQIAISTAEKIKNQNTRSANWIANDAIRELTQKIKKL